MEQCLGCLGMLFGSKRRKRKLKYLVNYKDGDDNLGVEFENLVLDDVNQHSYGTHSIPVISEEEREYINKRQYDRIIEEQRKVDEQIGKKLFDEEETLRVEEEAFYEAEREAAKAASMTMSLKERSSSLASRDLKVPDRDSLTLEEVEDDFEDFLEQVRNRSLAFRNQYASKETAKQPSVSESFDRGGDGQSSDDDFVLSENQNIASNGEKENIEWDTYTSGISHLPPDELRSTPLEKRLDPVGVGESGDDLAVEHKLNTSRTFGAIDKRLEAAERMFSITDDEEDMGEYVHA